jgi:hypothetical protein
MFKQYCDDCGEELCPGCGTCHKCLDEYILDIESESDRYKELFHQYKALYIEANNLIKKIQ